MQDSLFGLLLILSASILQGTFALFLRFAKPLAWENFWVIYSIVGVLLSPIILAAIVVPNFNQALLYSLTNNNLLLPLLFGGLWGIGSILFGLSATRIGLSLTYTIILGLTTLIGSILPLFINGTVPQGRVLLFLVLGLTFMLFGIILSGYSGYIRDKNSKIVEKSIIIGLTLAVISGVFSPLLNIAFVTGKGITQTAQDFGASSTNATALTWVIALFTGFLVNIIYAIFLLFRNKTAHLYLKINFRILLAAIAAGIFWYGSVALFGLASVKLGNLGPSIGWAMFISASIVISNLWAVKLGEWKSSKKAFSYQIVATTLIVIGIATIAISSFS